MIAGVGTDVVDLDRFRKLREKGDFLEQVFTEAELQEAPPGEAQDLFFAQVFAVKEALLKALACGLHPGSVWRQAEVTRGWKLRLSGQLERLANEKSIQTIHVSQSHSERSAVAFVVLETANQEEIA